MKEAAEIKKIPCAVCRDLMPLDRIVDMAVSRLRQRLRDTEKPSRLIRTVRGSGYQLAAEVSHGHDH